MSVDRRAPLRRHYITHDPGRFAITIAGVGFTVVLILFLLTLYDDVRVEPNGYIAAWRAQLGVGSGTHHQFHQGLFFVRLAVLECCAVRTT